MRTHIRRAVNPSPARRALFEADASAFYDALRFVTRRITSAAIAASSCRRCWNKATTIRTSDQDTTAIRAMRAERSWFGCSGDPASRGTMSRYGCMDCEA
jgi:hypothetical protein